MALDFTTPLTNIRALMNTIAGLEIVVAESFNPVSKGIPRSLTGRTSGYLALAGLATQDMRAGLVQATIRYLVAFGYRVEDAEDTAEDAVCTYAAAFVSKMLLPVNRSLSSSVESLSLDFSAASLPEFAIHTGQEFRIFPIVVVCTQRYPVGG